MKFYQYKKVDNFHYKITEKYTSYNRGILCFSSPFKSEYPSNNTVYVDIFEPSGKDRWCPIILLHSWMEDRHGPTERFAIELAKNGFGSYLLHLPYHINRASKGYKSGLLFITDNINSANAYRQAVIDVMALCDWLENRKETIKNNTGILGISLGALILNTVMGIDIRIKAGVSILGGGNLHYIFTRGLATLPIVVYGVLKGLRINELKSMTNDYVKYLKEVRKTKTLEEIENIPCMREWFLIDPLTFAHLNNPRQVLMINARFDLIIPYRATLQLYEALGRPQITWLPSTHITAAFFYKTILHNSLKYFNAHLNAEFDEIHR